MSQRKWRQPLEVRCASRRGQPLQRHEIWRWHRLGANAARAVIAAIVSLMAISIPAAAEGVSMPYRCTVERGEVRFVRGPERVHRIIGSREQQTVTVCGGPRAETCEAVVVHRFALECSGQPVPWVFVAAAGAHSQPWRASVAAGRMTLHFVRNGPLRDRANMVALPVGFAPAPIGGWRFVPSNAAAEGLADGTPSGADRGVPDATVLAGADDGGPTVGGRLDIERDISVTPAPRPVPRGGGAPARVDGVTSPPPMGAGWTASVATHDEARPSSVWGALPVAGSPGLTAALVFAALLLSATAVAARQRFAWRTPVVAIAPQPHEAEPAKGPPPPPLPTSALQKLGAETPLPPPPTPPVRTAMVPAHIDPATDPERSTWLQVAEMRATAEALLELDRQIVADHVPAGPLRDVLVADLGAIALRLDGPDLATALDSGRLDLVHPIYAQAIVDLERARTLARIEHERILAALGEWDRSLATPEEACAFLGVNPRASEAVVKKVVDALRQNWHPDQAGDDADRQAREMRIKRINAAWDLIRTR